MAARVGMLVIFVVLGLTLACDARKSVLLSGEDVHKEEVCALCEEYVGIALDYLEKNQTQEEIVKVLHDRCSQMRGLKQQCTALVDYYAPLFFLHLESLQPEDFCKQVNLCEQVVALAEELAQQNSCNVCHKTVQDILDKLQDPDTELDIIGLLLKGCKSLKNKDYEKQCKKVVFEYGPVVLVNAEEFLAKNDICSILHACSPGSSSSMADS